MKFFCFLFCLLFSFVASAQILWTDGEYSFVSRKSGSDLLFKNMKEKQGFVLRSTDNSGHVFVLERSGDPSFSIPIGEEGGLVSLTNENDGFDGSYFCLFFNDKNGNLLDVIQNFKISFADFCLNNIHMLLAGTYYNEKGEKIYIHSGGYTRGTDVMSYSVCSSNDRPTNVIRLQDGKLMMFCVSTTGFNVYEAIPDIKRPVFLKGKLIEKLRVSEDNGDGYSGRWGYATELHLLNRGFLEWFDKDMLRLMRNEIYAHHGYIFTSPDLREHFEAQSWYTKLDKKEDVKLYGMDLYNVNLIKMVENEADRKVAPTEPGY